MTPSPDKPLPCEDLPMMDENEWPVYAVLLKTGELYYYDTSWGNRYNTGDGWLMVLPWGEERERGGFHRGDNRFGVEHEDVAAFTILNPAPAPAAVRCNERDSDGTCCHTPQRVPKPAAVREAERRAEDLLVAIYRELPLSPLGYHPRGAAHRVFSMLMENLDLLNAIEERQRAALAAAKMEERNG